MSLIFSSAKEGINYLKTITEKFTKDFGEIGLIFYQTNL